MLHYNNIFLEIGFTQRVNIVIIIMAPDGEGVRISYGLKNTLEM